MIGNLINSAPAKDQILINAIPVIRDSYYVYFLIKNREIVYVGQTENYMARISAHMREKDFDFYSFFKVESREKALLVEAEAILKFQPKLNMTINEFFRSIPSIKAELKGYGVEDKVHHKNNIIKAIESLGIPLKQFKGGLYLTQSEASIVTQFICEG